MDRGSLAERTDRKIRGTACGRNSYFERGFGHGDQQSCTVRLLGTKEILLSRDGTLLFGQFPQTRGGSGKPEPHAFSFIARKEQVTAEGRLQLKILPDGGHQARRRVRSRAQQQVS